MYLSVLCFVLRNGPAWCRLLCAHWFFVLFSEFINFDYSWLHECKVVQMCNNYESWVMDLVGNGSVYCLVTKCDRLSAVLLLVICRFSKLLVCCMYCWEIWGSASSVHQCRGSYFRKCRYEKNYACHCFSTEVWTLRLKDDSAWLCQQNTSCFRVVLLLMSAMWGNLFWATFSFAVTLNHIIFK